MRVANILFAVAGAFLIHTETDQEVATRLWVPIVRQGRTSYFNPATNAVSSVLPKGARAAPAVAFMQDADDSGEGDEIEAQDEDTQTTKVHAVQADTAPEAEVSETKSCYPQCTWNCTKPVCNQDCTPECEQPTCQTRCPRPDYNDCKIDCQTPHCSVFCPRDACKSLAGKKCSSPKCSTQCARPICKLQCKNRVPCQNVCHPPACSWNCRNPKLCHKPECRLVCERPLGCAQNYELPPLSPALTVERSFTADRARWVSYEWGQCSMRCGKGIQTRKVLCSTGEEHECQFGTKPPTEKECEGLADCNKWQTSTWSGCNATCGKGFKTRTVTCSNSDETECFGAKPHDMEACRDHGAHCSQCKVHLYGNQDFSGWQANFAPGTYDTEDMIAHGAKCEEVSAIKVLGECCVAKFYQYGDFNRRNKGWTAELPHGEYDGELMVEAGVANNDVSAMKVYLDSKCSTPGRLSNRFFRTGSGGSTGGSTSAGAAGEGGDDGAQGGGGSRAEADRRKEERMREMMTGDSEKTTDGKESSANGVPQMGANGMKQYPWWFWVLILVLLVVVATGVYLALRRRSSM
mmetsp:Transcript_41758/g.88460  ORF Transcript_41758/g.88460 Transcript_41758/m.88460 type:complete len:576 (+) Transcript_41758:110-1837(+)